MTIKPLVWIDHDQKWSYATGTPALLTVGVMKCDLSNEWRSYVCVDQSGEIVFEDTGILTIDMAKAISELQYKKYMMRFIDFS